MYEQNSDKNTKTIHWGKASWKNWKSVRGKNNKPLPLTHTIKNNYFEMTKT